MMRKTLNLIAIAVIVIFFASCEKETISQTDAGIVIKHKTPTIPGDTTHHDTIPKVDTMHFAATIVPMLNSSCGGCHDGVNQDPNFSGDAATTYAAINTNTYINRTTPAQSFLYTHILDAGHGGGQFPVEAAKILTWIGQGAKNNKKK